MTFIKIRKRIAEIIGVDYSDTTADSNDTLVTKLKEWVNNRYLALASSRSWNWTIKDAVIQTATEITTGTVTATLASTSITFSNAPTPSVAAWFIQFSDSEDWYQIATHTAATTSAVLSNAYLGTTSSTLTYKLRKVYYALPSDLSKILNLKQTRDDITLKYLSARIVDNLVPDKTRTGKPAFYTISGLDSSRQYRAEFYPVADVAMNINLRYYSTVTELSSDSDVPLIPAAFHDFLVWDTLATYGFMFMDDTRISAAKALANELYKKLEDNDVATEDIPIRMAFDDSPSQNYSQLNQENFPIA